MAKRKSDLGPEDLGRLVSAMKRSRLVLRRSREERASAIREFVGNHYSDNGTDKAVPINLLSLYVSIVSKNLIAKNPRALISIDDRSKKPLVAAMQQWVNKEIERMGLQRSLERVVLDGLFSLGICKVALASPSESANAAWNLRAGTAFAKAIDLDDFAVDPTVKDLTEASFQAHRYRVPLEAIRDDQTYSKARKLLVASNDEPYNQEGDERAKRIGQGYYGQEEFEDMVDLWEVYLPRHKLIVTLPDDRSGNSCLYDKDGQGEPLRIQRWVGPDRGPFVFLQYGTVPANAMPKAPIQDLMDLHLFCNQGYRKLMDQTNDQKTILLVRGAAAEDGNRVINANNGEAVLCDDPAGMVQVSYAAPDAKNFQMIESAIAQFKTFAGNLDLAGGLAPQSKTATQDKMLNENASRSIVDLQERTIDFTEDVMRNLCWYWHNDPYKVMKYSHEVPGVAPIEGVVTPEDRAEVPFEDLGIKIDPYSMQHQTPQTILGVITQVLNLWAPMQQQAAQQGVVMDFNELFANIAELTNVPVLKDMLKFMQPPQAESATPGDQGGGGMPVNTNREYTRHNVAEGTSQSQSNQAVAAMHQADGNTTGGVQPQ